MVTKSPAIKPLPTRIPDYEYPIPFDENFKWGKSITFTADSYMKWLREALPLIDKMEPVGMEAASLKNVKEKGIYIGENKLFYLRTMPIYHYTNRMFSFVCDRVTRASLLIVKSHSEGEVRFDDNVHIPILCNMSLEPWMSLTPNEILTQRGAIRRSKGNVAMAGLGMGWAARKVLNRNKVDHLTIYEIDQHVIDFFGKPLIDEFGDKVEIINSNAYDADWMQYDVAIWDIWISYGNANYDKKYLKIREDMKKMNKTCIGWGEGYTGSNRRIY